MKVDYASSIFTEYLVTWADLSSVLGGGFIWREAVINLVEGIWKKKTCNVSSYLDKRTLRK